MLSRGEVKKVKASPTTSYMYTMYIQTIQHSPSGILLVIAAPKLRSPRPLAGADSPHFQGSHPLSSLHSGQRECQPCLCLIPEFKVREHLLYTRLLCYRFSRHLRVNNLDHFFAWTPLALLLYVSVQIFPFIMS